MSDERNLTPGPSPLLSKGEGRTQDSTMTNSRGGEAEDALTEAREQARRHLLEAVQGEGYAAQNAEDAWGKLVGVQAAIALDAGNGSKATAAAKLVAQATGMLAERAGLEGLSDLPAEMTSATARRVLAWMEGREEGNGD